MALHTGDEFIFRRTRRKHGVIWLRDSFLCLACNATMTLLISLQEWSLEEWNKERAKFAFLNNTLEIVVVFAPETTGQSAKLAICNFEFLPESLSHHFTGGYLRWCLWRFEEVQFSNYDFQRFLDFNVCVTTFPLPIQKVYFIIRMLGVLNWISLQQVLEKDFDY